MGFSGAIHLDSNKTLIICDACEQQGGNRLFKTIEIGSISSNDIYILSNECDRNNR